MSSEQATTPLMEQYLAIKKKHKDAILFFRMGDFYEMFFEDAETGSRVLGIVLTSRAHGKSANVPLAGFPYHALDSYLARMVKAGYRVAICEQIEDPKFAKTIVKRKVMEVVTPGTALTDDLLETKRNNYLCSIQLDSRRCGVAKADISTGEFQVTEIPRTEIKETILSIDPSELLVSESQQDAVMELLGNYATMTITKRDDWTFQYDYAYESIKDHFSTLSLKGFGIDDMAAGIAAAGAILAYLKENQQEKLVHINQISQFSDQDHLVIDSTTRRNLELVKSMSGIGRRGTLMSILDKTSTPMGGRRLVSWLLYPLRNLSAITARQDAVEELVKNVDMRRQVSSALRKCGDLERLIAKLAAGRANARDVLGILHTLHVTLDVKTILNGVHSPLLKGHVEGLQYLQTLVSEIERAVIDNPPLSITDGGIIRRGYNKELDELRDIAFSGKDWIAQLQNRERERTGISSLKVNFNKVFGYYIEITKPHLSKVPPHYIRKQTLVNAERYIVQELKEYEEKILGAEERMATLEYDLFDNLRKVILISTRELQENALHLSEVDCLASFAEVAVEENYTRPEVNEEDSIQLIDGRHPVIEKLLPVGESFVVNDTRIDSRNDQILIITGPNMAGKSTYLRQVGLLVIMAQMGSFIPVKSAKIGLVDRVFTRVGASDNLAAGESTFLTEMIESANILNNATPKSLILLDEIGRGTSTFDGLSIAWAVVEYIHNTPRVAAKTIFATHFHELTELEMVLSRVKNYNIAVKEWGDHVVFLRKIVKGGCDHSYGIHVAQLAGLPKAVILRAKEVLANLESEALDAAQVPKLARHQKTASAKTEQLSLFIELERSLREELNKIDPNTLTPIEALNKLDQLKQLVIVRE
jgi:DNA mismatch repair protein MutS